MILSEEDYKRVLSTVPIVCIDCLVVNDAGEYLLVKRKNEPLKGEYWVPGGRLHKNERLADAVNRKMLVEIGIKVEVVRLLGFFEEFFAETAQQAEGGMHSVSFLYLVKPLTGVIRLDDQSAEWGWFKEMPARLKEYCTHMNPLRQPGAGAGAGVLNIARPADVMGGRGSPASYPLCKRAEASLCLESINSLQLEVSAPTGGIPTGQSPWQAR